MNRDRPKLAPIAIEFAEHEKEILKFLSLTYQPEFKNFLNWMGMLRGEINRIDGTIPKLTIDATRDDIYGAGVKSMINRAKVSMLDDIIKFIANVQKKKEAQENNKKPETEEAENG